MYNAYSARPDPSAVLYTPPILAWALRRSQHASLAQLSLSPDYSVPPSLRPSV
eukprot:CAMPEP_0181198998 /NCGR_PEP_ID=MMETSP1096-20121128/16938_1 /TAXON_ID=156174 ORGANISM="Chrysochromulina ericina, Strain CCMP281" /NCGR_SAMPLE_ID=MMETSP1096 /ASSEMBLY_ACC=CAM_ASM_000453 /LENGTH=52 /DNA_ID=CAMNT_0023289143 /DNA_START=275 /DNA_END=430 /DNA_ORIENTATION=+